MSLCFLSVQTYTYIYRICPFNHIHLSMQVHSKHSTLPMHSMHSIYNSFYSCSLHLSLITILYIFLFSPILPGISLFSLPFSLHPLSLLFTSSFPHLSFIFPSSFPHLSLILPFLSLLLLFSFLSLLSFSLVSLFSFLSFLFSFSLFSFVVIVPRSSHTSNRHHDAFQQQIPGVGGV